MSDNFENKENEEVLNSDVTEEVDEVVEEATEEAIGEAELVDSVESVVDEGMHEVIDVSGVEESAEPSVQYAIAESGIEDIPVKNRKGVVIGIVIALVVAILAGAGVFAFFVAKAPYNYLGYINVSGRTVQDIADMQGGTLEDFLATYGLPADMPATTEEAAAYYMIPTGVIAQMYGMDFEMLKESLQLPDQVSELPLRMKLIDLISNKFNVGTTIDENTPWGISEGEAPLSTYVGEENLDAFKEEYGLGDDVTGETTWKEVRNIVDKASLASREEVEAAQAQAEMEGADDVVDEGEVEADGIEVVSEDELPPEVAEAIKEQE